MFISKHFVHSLDGMTLARVVTFASCTYVVLSWIQQVTLLPAAIVEIGIVIVLCICEGYFGLLTQSREAVCKRHTKHVREKLPSLLVATRPSEGHMHRSKPKQERKRAGPNARNCTVQRGLANLSSVPDEQSNLFTSELQAAARTDNLSACESLMQRVQEQGIVPSIVCYGVLIGAYARAAQPAGCERWLEALLDAHNDPPNAITMNIVINSWAKAGNIERAEFWLKRMPKMGVKPEVVTYNAMIDACARSAEVSEAEAWFEAIRASDLEPNIVSYSSILHACAKAGDFVRAETWFKRLERRFEPNAICFNSVITACCKVGDFYSASCWIKKMRSQGVAPTVNSFSTVVDYLVKAGRMREAEAWLSDMIDSGVGADVIVFSMLLSGYARAGDEEKAAALYQRMIKLKVEPNLFCFNTLVGIHARVHDTAGTAKWLAQMRGHRIKGDSVTFRTAVKAFTGSMDAAGALELFNELQDRTKDPSSLLNAALNVCVRAEDLKRTEDMMHAALVKGFKVDAHCFTLLLDSFAKLGAIDGAEQLLNCIETNGMKAPYDVYVAFIHSLLASGDTLSVEAGLQRMMAAHLTPTAAMFHTIIRLYAQEADVTSAERWLQLMRELPHGADVSCYTAVIHACAKANDLVRAESWFETMERDGVHANVVAYNAVINACARAADIARAEAWFSRMGAAKLTPCALTFNSLINAGAKAGDAACAERWIMHMRKVGVAPDIISYCTAIHACTQANLPERAEIWLLAMRAEGLFARGVGIEKDPGSFCLNAVLQAFARTDRPREAEEWLEVALQETSVSPASFGAIVAAYIRAGDPDQAEKWLTRMIKEGYPIVWNSGGTPDAVADAWVAKGHHRRAEVVRRMAAHSSRKEFSSAHTRTLLRSNRPIGAPKEWPAKACCTH